MPFKHNQILWSKDDIMDITQGEWILNEPDHLFIKGKCLTPDLCEKDFIYMAYGKNSADKRMDLVIEALKKGASLIITDTKKAEFPSYASVLYVKKLMYVNRKFAFYSRDETDAKVIAITGSVGKTSTKDMVAEMLSYRGLTYSNFRSINGGSGLENEVANISKETKFCVFELGMKAPNTIQPMSMLVKPHIALITSIAPVHVSYHDGMESIVTTKIQIADGLEKNGTLILPRDSEYYEQMKTLAESSRDDITICSFGKDESSDIQLISYSSYNTYSIVNVSVFGKEFEYKVPFIEDYKIYNSLGALATVYFTNEDIKESVKGLSFVKSSYRRGERFRGELKNSPGVIEIIDDTWNANPVSMHESIKQMQYRIVPRSGRRGILLGDMAELGEDSKKYHQQLEKVIQDSKIDFVCCVGEEMQNLYNVLPESIEKHYAKNINALLPRLDSIIQSNDVILVKGSNSTHMYKAVLHFIGDYNHPRALSSWSLEKESFENNTQNQKLNSFDEELSRFMEKHNICGGSVAVSFHEKKYLKGYGAISTNEQIAIDPMKNSFRLFSLTKPITAVAVLLLVQDGKLKLTDKVFGKDGILSSFMSKKGEVNSELNKIEVIHLLQHTAGWSLDKAVNPFTGNKRFDPMFNLGNIAKALGKSPYATKEDVIEYMLEHSLDFETGTQYSYSNLGYNILGRIIETISNQSYFEFIKNKILEPLNLNSITLAKTKFEDRSEDEVYYYSQNPDQYKTALFDKTCKVKEPYGIFMIEEFDSHGGLIGTSSDMLKFILNFDTLLTENTLKEIIKKPNIENRSNTNWHYGLGWRVTAKKDGTVNLWHRGTINVGGATGFMVRSLEKNSFSWVVLFNKSVNLSEVEKMMINALPKLQEILK